METWVPAHGFPGYMVSDEGRVFSLLRSGRYLTTGSTSGWSLKIGTKGKPLSIKIGRLVLTSFGVIAPDENCVHRNINGDFSDNRLINLVWKRRSSRFSNTLSKGIKPKIFYRTLDRLQEKNDAVTP